MSSVMRCGRCRFFSDETEIRWQPAPGPDAFVLEFKIVAELEGHLR